MKKITSLIIAVLLLFTSGCTARNLETTPGEIPGGKSVTFTDALGHSVTVTNPGRVAAASGSFARVWQLAGGRLTGATRDAFDDGTVSAAYAADIGGNHSPSAEVILSLNTDFVILSANIPGQVKLYDLLSAAGINIAYFSVETFKDYQNMLKIFTDITGREDLYMRNGSDIQTEIDGIIGRTDGEPSPKVLLLRASSGKVSVLNSDSMAGIMLKDMGCVNIADSDNGLLDNLSMETIIEQDPDFIFATTMGEPDKAEAALCDTLLSNPAWRDLSAVKNDRYILLPKDLFHEKPNDRWAEAYEKLWEILYGRE